METRRCDSVLNKQEPRFWLHKLADKARRKGETQRTPASTGNLNEAHLPRY